MNERTTLTNIGIETDKRKDENYTPLDINEGLDGV